MVEEADEAGVLGGSAGPSHCGQPAAPARRRGRALAPAGVRGEDRSGPDTQQTLEPASQQTEREEEIISWIYYKARSTKNSHVFTSPSD